MLRRIWPDAVVEESNLTQNVFTLRKTLGDSPEGARFIATVPRRGYRFVAPVVPLPGAWPATPAPEPEAAPPPGRASRRSVVKATAAVLAVLLLPLAGYLAGRRVAEPAAPKLTRLTFRRGIVRGARFAPDGRTVVYSAAWDGGRGPQLFLSRPATPESMKLGAPAAELAAVSSAGELALALRPTPLFHQMGEFRTLARAPLTGGVPREVLEDVESADWSPDGQALAVVRKVDRLKRLEYLIGRVLVEPPRDSASTASASPATRLVAFRRCSKPGAPSRSWMPRAGGERCGPASIGSAASRGRPAATSCGSQARGRLRARAVDLGRVRPLATPGALTDVSREGPSSSDRHPALGSAGGAGRRQSRASWLEGSAAVDLSADGSQLLFGEFMEGGGVSGRIYLRGADGSPAVHLGDGYPFGLSPDGKWAAVSLHGRDGLTFLPTGPGETRTVATGTSACTTRISSRRPAAARLEDRPRPRGQLVRRRRRAASDTPEATGVGVVSPDGKWVARWPTGTSSIRWTEASADRFPA